jgi:hypothetical protein
MKKINSSFTIGTLGIIFTAILQILTTLFVSSRGLHVVFYILYPVFIIMLVIGFRKIIKEKNLV